LIHEFQAIPEIHCYNLHKWNHINFEQNSHNLTQSREKTLQLSILHGDISVKNVSNSHMGVSSKMFTTSDVLQDVTSDTTNDGFFLLSSLIAYGRTVLQKTNKITKSIRSKDQCSNQKKS
jgi:hypothetical protein